MQPLRLAIDPEKELNVLCLGAHCDDIEIGCGGTLLKLKQTYKNIRFYWVVFTSNEIRREEALRSADLFLKNVEKKEIKIFDYRDGFLPSVWSEVKYKFEQLKSAFSPDLIFTHYRKDLHQDHRTVNELTWNTYRNHLILEYEIPKYDDDLGNPNLFVPLEETYVEKKKEIIVKCFNSQLDKQWLDETLLNSIMRIRGVDCATDLKFAEAFFTRKMIF